MATFWNKLQLNSAPLATCYYLKHEIKFDKWLKFYSDLKNSMEHLNKQKILNSEIIILEKLLQLLKRPFRHEKFLGSLNMVYKCLKRMQNLDIYKIFDDFVQLFPEEIINPYFVCDLYLPSRQSLEYLLIRLAGLSQLLIQLIGYCKQTFHLSLQKIAIRVFYLNHIMVIGVISRIWILSKNLVCHLIEWYNKFYSWSKKMKSIQTLWIIKENLPQNLINFLGEDNIPEKEGLIDDPDIDFTVPSTNVVPRCFTVDLKDKNDTDIGIMLDRKKAAVLMKASSQSKRKNKCDSVLNRKIQTMNNVYNEMQLKSLINNKQTKELHSLNDLNTKDFCTKSNIIVENGDKKSNKVMSCVENKSRNLILKQSITSICKNQETFNPIFNSKTKDFLNQQLSKTDKNGNISLKMSVFNFVNKMKKISEIRLFYNHIQMGHINIPDIVIPKKFNKQSLKKIEIILERMLSRLKLAKDANKPVSNIVVQEKKKLIKCICKILN